MRKVAVVGTMFSGKTTFAQALLDREDANYARLSFAQPVKEASLAMLNAFLDSVEAQRNIMNLAELEEMKTHPSIRKLLQYTGTELGRNWLGPDTIWIDRMLARALQLGQTYDLVCDDCRFPNEAAALRNAGWNIIRINRDEEARLNDLMQSLRKRNPDWTASELDATVVGMLNHPSETQVASLPVDTDIYVDEGVESVQRWADIYHTTPWEEFVEY